MQIGVDFGGTKIEVAALDRSGGFAVRRRTANPGRYEDAIKAICELVSSVEASLGESGTVGVGVPGSLSLRSDVMRNANAIWLNGRRFRDDLSAALGREIRVANDANCLALSEASDGVTVGAQSAFAIILGTGCGGGLTIRGELVSGANGIGGEWGHTPLPWAAKEETEGPQCWCGKKGCLETWISGPGLSNDYQGATGKTLGAQGVVEAARAGESAAEAALDRFIDRLGRAIAVVSNIVDPEIVVLGGGLSNVTEIFDRTPSIVKRYVFSDEWNTKIVPAKWGDSSGVRGAARLWPSAPARETSARTEVEIARR